MRDNLVSKRTDDFWLTGFENNNSGKGGRFNFILSNGERTEQGFRGMQSFMMPEACK